MGEAERDLRVVTDDGEELSTDVYHPEGVGPFPTLMQRTCYGKEVLAEWTGVSRYVEAGYRVVMQDCRGSGLSTGESNFFLEARDGRACGDWIAGQPWFDGRLGTFGASYMSFTQWAFASTRPPYLSAMAIATLGTERGAAWYPGGSFALDIALPWTATMVHGLDAIQPQNQASVEAAFAHLPLEDADRVAVGQTVKWYQDWLRYPGKDDPHWKPIDYTNALDLGIPTLLVDGWYDYAVSLVIGDHRILRANGTPARLVVGPWTHFSASEVMFDETVRWFDRFVKGDEAIDTRGPVNVFVMPDVGWRELPEWPPAVDVQRWYLQPDAALALARPPVSDPTRTCTTPRIRRPSSAARAYGWSTAARSTTVSSKRAATC